MHHSSNQACQLQVLRQPEGTYTAQEHALRVSPIVLEPIGAYSLHCLLQWLLKIRDKRLARYLKSLQTKMKKMVHDLKVCHPSHKIAMNYLPSLCISQCRALHASVPITMFCPAQLPPTTVH